MNRRDGLDVVGYWDSSGLQFCLRCAPAAYHDEHHELHRFEANDECVQCGADLTQTSKALGPYR